VKPSTSQIRSLCRRDPVLARAIRVVGKFPGFPTADHRRTPTFQYLARSIVFQQLAYKAADTIWNRVVTQVAEYNGGNRRVNPAGLDAVGDQQLRGAGLSRAKLAAVRDLSARCQDRRLKLRGLSRQSNEAIVERLSAVRGIGPWTAQMFLIFKLGRLDVLPTTDLGVQEGLRMLEGRSERPTPKQLAVRGACWSPLASVAAWVLWRVADGDGPGECAEGISKW